jgi:hypothetical protein
MDRIERRTKHQPRHHRPLRTRLALAVGMAALSVMNLAGPALGHPHIVANPDHNQVMANGQNHPGFQPVNDDGLRLSCEGVLQPANAGPAGYGLETAHHGPDAGSPGKSDGCYATVGDPRDDNPAID